MAPAGGNTLNPCNFPSNRAFISRSHLHLPLSVHYGITSFQVVALPGHRGQAAGPGSLPHSCCAEPTSRLSFVTSLVGAGKSTVGHSLCWLGPISNSCSRSIVPSLFHWVSPQLTCHFSSRATRLCALPKPIASQSQLFHPSPTGIIPTT